MGTFLLIRALTEEELGVELARLPHWERREGWIVSTFEFADFLTAVDFLSAVTALAEERRHYPVITLDRQLVTLELSTPEAGDKLTQKDIDFAHSVELLQLDYDVAPEDTGLY
jgi:4a-hydroxytetrahydrobiopterin dehydratase